VADRLDDDVRATGRVEVCRPPLAAAPGQLVDAELSGNVGPVHPVDSHNELGATVLENVTNSSPMGPNPRTAQRSPEMSPRRSTEHERGAGACVRAFGASPVFLFSGGTIPAAGLLRQLLGIPVVLLGLALPNDRAHAPNERFHLPNLWSGIATSVWFLAELASIQSGRMPNDDGRMSRRDAADRLPLDQAGPGTVRAVEELDAGYIGQSRRVARPRTVNHRRCRREADGDLAVVIETVALVACSWLGIRTRAAGWAVPGYRQGNDRGRVLRGGGVRCGHTADTDRL
jgi:hypothetical protein